jgi:cytochrome c peroxidase
MAWRSPCGRDTSKFRDATNMSNFRVKGWLGALALTASGFLAAANSPHTVAGGAMNNEDCGDEACIAVLRGIFAFIDRGLTGLKANGRSCADCHMPADSFQLSPAGVEARYQSLQRRRQWNKRADDPLFRPIDADDFREHGEHAADFANLRENALVRITFPLPANLRLIDPATNAISDETSVDVWRSVPTVFNARLTGPDGLNPWARGPNPSGGYQLDGRIDTLQNQAAGALRNHAQAQFAPAQRLLDDLAAFQNMLFSSRRVRLLSDAIRLGAPVLPDTDPPLDALALRGKSVFTRSCAHCHGGPGQSTPQPPVVRYHDISSQCPRPVDAVVPARFHFKPCPSRLARNARTYEITLANGTTLLRASSDPGRALQGGLIGGPPGLDDWNKFDMPSLHGIGRTAPYFHNNSADSLEEVVDHYTAFFKRVPTIIAPGARLPPVISTDGVNADRAFTPEERAALLAYLRKL